MTPILVIADVLLTVWYVATLYRAAKSTYQRRSLTPDLDALVVRSLNALDPGAGDRAARQGDLAVIRHLFLRALPAGLWAVVLTASITIIAVALIMVATGAARGFDITLVSALAVGVSYIYHIARIWRAIAR